MLCLAYPCVPISGRISLITRFSYKDIKKATDGFHRVVYSNSRGAAYKARFRDGGVALIKEIKDLNQEKEVFYRDVQLLGRLHHRHLLQLRGFSTGSKRFDCRSSSLFFAMHVLL